MSNDQAQCNLHASVFSAVAGWEKSLVSAWPVDKDNPQDSWHVGTIDEENEYPVLTVEADQYDAPGESEKIARAIVALWPLAFASPEGLQEANDHLKFTIVPAGNPNAEAVFWNALIECRSALRTDFRAASKQSALAAIDEAAQFKANLINKTQIVTTVDAIAHYRDHGIWHRTDGNPVEFNLPEPAPMEVLHLDGSMTQGWTSQHWNWAFDHPHEADIIAWRFYDKDRRAASRKA